MDGRLQMGEYAGAECWILLVFPILVSYLNTCVICLLNSRRCLRCCSSDFQWIQKLVKCKMSLSELELDCIQRIIDCIYPHAYFWTDTTSQQENKLSVRDHSLPDSAASGAEVKERSLQRHDFSALPHFLPTAKSVTFLQKKLIRISKREHRSF